MKKLTSIVVTLMLTLASASCGTSFSPASHSSPSLPSRLPASLEIDGWELSGPSTTINDDTALYNQIDGGAPKYIDRGWVSSVYATYLRGDNTIQVAIHDMGSPENAQSLYLLDLPVSRVQIDGYPSAIIDTGLATSYQATAAAGRFYIEVSCAARSDAALDYVKQFIVAIIKRCS